MDGGPRQPRGLSDTDEDVVAGNTTAPTDRGREALREAGGKLTLRGEGSELGAGGDAELREDVTEVCRNRSR